MTVRILHGDALEQLATLAAASVHADTAYRLVGDFGEQVVSRNHRCLVERNGVEAFQPAETLQREARVPVLESLPALQRALSDAQQNAGDSQQGLQPKVRGGANRKGEQWVDAVGRTEGPNRRLRSLPETGMEAGCMVAQGDAASVQLSVQRGTARGRVEDSRPQRTRQVAACVGSGAEGSDDWGDESGLEGRADLSEAEGRLRRPADQVRALSDVDAGHGSQRWLRDATPADSGADDWSHADEIGIGSPHQPRRDRQQAKESDAVSNERRAQGIRAWSGHQPALVRVVPFHYTGKVWCLRVPTGAFVAVRNGVAFPTGNSGFPKSLDVSKAIDRANGREFEDRFALGRHIRERREAKCVSRADVNSWLDAATKCEHYESESASFARVPTLADWHVLRERLDLDDIWLALVERIEAEREVIGKAGWNNSAAHFVPGEDHTQRVHLDITAPATDAARQWQGWGTALKPAHEPIVVARKPLIGTVAANVLKHGTGAINVDACRVDAPNGLTSGGRKSSSPLHMDRDAGINRVAERSEEHAAGRWPANLIHDGSDEVLAGFPAEAGGGSFAMSGTRNVSGKSRSFGAFDQSVKNAPDNYGDSGSAARFFYTAKASRDDRNIGCDDLESQFAPTMGNGIGGKEHDPETATRKRNHHPTVKPTDLMQYLVRLVTPPGGTVLDPFAGSGSTGLAADREGFDAILIEREAEYVEIARRRIVGDCPLFAELAA